MNLQYMQIAENVLAKLPSSMQIPETRHSQQIKETKISRMEHTGENAENEDKTVITDPNEKHLELDEDLV